MNDMTTPAAADAAGEPASEGKLNTTAKSQVTVKYTPNRHYFRPDTSEIIEVLEKEAAAFEAHGYHMCKLVDDVHRANQAVSNAVSRYSQVMNSHDPVTLAGAKKEYEKAHKELQKAQVAVSTELKVIDPLAKLAAGGSSIVELIPLRKNSAGDRRPYGKKSVFVVSKQIHQRWPRIRLDPTGGAGAGGPPDPNTSATPHGAENLITRDAAGNRKIDTAKLMKQFKDVKPEIKAELYKKDLFSGILFEWAEAMNKDLVWEPKLSPRFSKNVDISAKAQLMRYAGGLGAESSWDPKSGKAGIKAEAKAEFSLAEGKASVVLYAPHRIGWVLKMTSLKGKVYQLGAVRAQAEFVLAGVVGASVVLEGAMEVESTALKVGLRGVPAPTPPPAPPLDPNQGPDIAEAPSKTVVAKVEAGVFAGIKADLDLNGSLQWLNPENKEKKFEDFIKIAPGVSAMAGAGASAKFEVTYNKGKFHLVMAASLCWGVGARGKIAFETNALLIGNFMVWFHYQLYHVNFDNLLFVGEQAFLAAQNLQFLAIQSGKKIEKFMLSTYEEIEGQVESVLNILDKSEMRNALATRVLSDSTLLRHSTPETKGMLLYQLTRHGKADWADAGNYDLGDAYATRKKAVLHIMRWVQTHREWNNVLQHMSPLGRKTGGTSRAHVLRFLQLGYDNMDDELLKLESRLKMDPSRGYAIAANDTLEYRMFESDSPQFAMASIEPLTSMDVSHMA